MGLFTALVLTLSAGQAPAVSVLVTRRMNVDRTAALELAELFSVALEGQKDRRLGQLQPPRAVAATLAASNTPDTADCQGSSGCAAALGKVARLDRLVGLQLVKLGAEALLEAALIDVASGKVLATASGNVPLRRPEAAVQAIAAELSARAPPWVPLPPPPPPALAKAAPSPSPAPVPAPVAPAAGTGPAPAARAAGAAGNGWWWIPAASGAALTAGGAVLWRLASAEQREISRGAASKYTTYEAMREARARGELQQGFGFGLLAAGVAGLSLGGGVLLFGQGAAPPGGVAVELLGGGARVAVGGVFP